MVTGSGFDSDSHQYVSVFRRFVPDLYQWREGARATRNSIKQRSTVISQIKMIVSVVFWKRA